MKKDKLNLSGLKVQSFVTKSNKAKGGFTVGAYCEPTDPDPCGSTGCPGGTNYTNCNCGSGYTCAYTCGQQTMDVSAPCMC